MARFKFTLAPVQTVRQIDADARQRDLQAAVAELQVALSAVQDAESRQQVVWMTRPADPRQAIQHERYAALLTAELESRKAEAKACEDKVEAARVALTEAQRDLEAINSLETRQKTTWLAERQKAEQSMLDEMATLRHR